ncbi:DNA-binding transcriptional regulator [Acidaminococcus sp. NSJ-142]|jgi:central glycolytic genes regulator|uniref:sugar-binding transcriptional regulator n=1 Tax=Acidaminococcus TaxID=904 RepID=UPI000CFA4B00|nr:MULTISPECIES: sugar-binding domain-containing protein [Acidaminococcus]MCD2435416.1 DNA-binding transcriptional regulator [Acidaminococcus hominis]MCH4095805.1 DNA-binding transcriptional regulator [Acidaminococcus provencensis]RHK01956.1 DNA-binding transcriptional regulator [Acidaminococcus sp. AM05-11]
MKPMSLDQVINLQNKLVPEMVQLLIERYKVLRQISHDQPVGRRTLAKTLGISERILRSHVDFLKEAGLLDFSLTGMSITEEGAALLQELQDYVNRLQKLSSLAQLLEEKLHLQKAVVIPGDADLDPVGTREIGRVAAGILLRLLGDHKAHIVAVTGGTTMAALAENIYGNEPHCTVVPARGGLGDKMELQANTIATVLAGRLKTKYLQLYVPDSVSEDVLDKILEEDAGVKQVVETIKSADILVHGMGQAQVMAEKRGVDPCIIARLKEEGAVGEALGQYFSLDGRVVYSTDTLGLMVNDLEKIHTVMGIAGGHSKGPAILSVLRSGKQDILVTDEAAAREIINCLQMENNHKLDNI